MKTIVPVCISLAILLIACTAAQQPYQFVHAGAQPATVDSISRALSVNGQQVAEVDPSGIVRTGWQDTGFRYGKIDGVEATILRRYVVTLQPTGTGTVVVMRVDSKRCASGGFEIGGALVTGRCEAMNEIVAQQQEELNTLGQSLQTSLATGIFVQTTPVATQ